MLLRPKYPLVTTWIEVNLIELLTRISGKHFPPPLGVSCLFTAIYFILISPDLDTVCLRVEGSGVVELEDDQREGVSLRHLLVIVQGPHLGAQNIIIQDQKMYIVQFMQIGWTDVAGSGLSRSIKL